MSDNVAPHPADPQNTRHSSPDAQLHVSLEKSHHPVSRNFVSSVDFTCLCTFFFLSAVRNRVHATTFQLLCLVLQLPFGTDANCCFFIYLSATSGSTSRSLHPRCDRKVVGTLPVQWYCDMYSRRLLLLFLVSVLARAGPNIVWRGHLHNIMATHNRCIDTRSEVRVGNFSGEDDKCQS